MKTQIEKNKNQEKKSSELNLKQQIQSFITRKNLKIPPIGSTQGQDNPMLYLHMTFQRFCLQNIIGCSFSYEWADIFITEYDGKDLVRCIVIFNDDDYWVETQWYKVSLSFLSTISPKINILFDKTELSPINADFTPQPFFLISDEIIEPYID